MTNKPTLRIIICGGYHRFNLFRLKTIIDKLKDCAIIQELIVGDYPAAMITKATAAEMVIDMLPDIPVRTFPIPKIKPLKKSLVFRDYRMMEESGGNLVILFGDEGHDILNHAKMNKISYILANYSKSTFKINGVTI